MKEVLLYIFILALVIAVAHIIRTHFRHRYIKKYLGLAKEIAKGLFDAKRVIQNMPDNTKLGAVLAIAHDAALNYNNKDFICRVVDNSYGAMLQLKRERYAIIMIIMVRDEFNLDLISYIESYSKYAEVFKHIWGKYETIDTYVEEVEDNEV